MRRWLRRLWERLAITLSVLGLLTVLAAGLYKIVELSQDGKQAHDAICALKGDLSKRIDSSRDFLRDHPAGIAGIPAATIKQGVDNQQRTLDALRDVKCSPEERQQRTKGE